MEFLIYLFIFMIISLYFFIFLSIIFGIIFIYSFIEIKKYIKNRKIKIDFWCIITLLIIQIINIYFTYNSYNKLSNLSDDLINNIQITLLGLIFVLILKTFFVDYKDKVLKKKMNKISLLLFFFSLSVSVVIKILISVY
ncbi:hypothetical protein [Oceanivirga salmonicida]|uniref:hypothetical protein n=1 Tax=Oceanivirga salmonicida TaxID=1769291 RepID=UPI0012E2BCF9|nr:hypothetical protein [Oceanivirga salmonicida]